MPARPDVRRGQQRLLLPQRHASARGQVRAPRTSDTNWAGDAWHTAAHKEACGDTESSRAEGNTDENDAAPARDSRSETTQLKFTRFLLYRRRLMRGCHNGRG